MGEAGPSEEAYVDKRHQRGAENQQAPPRPDRQRAPSRIVTRSRGERMLHGLAVGRRCCRPAPDAVSSPPGHAVSRGRSSDSKRLELVLQELHLQLRPASRGHRASILLFWSSSVFAASASSRASSASHVGLEARVCVHRSRWSLRSRRAVASCSATSFWLVAVSC